MDAVGIGLIAIFCILVLNLTLTYVMIRVGVHKIENSVNENAVQLAQIIQNTVDQLPLDMDANPIQMAIASWIGEQAKTRSNVIETTVLPRNDKGQFANEDISS